VTQVNLLLPDSHSVLKIEFLSRSRATDPWHPVSQGEFLSCECQLLGAQQRADQYPRSSGQRLEWGCCCLHGWHTACRMISATGRRP
jgi:hypothetical protein